MSRRLGMGMKVLIVEPSAALAAVWQNHLERLGMTVRCADGQTEAAALLASETVDVIVLDLVLQDGSALAVADLAGYRRPGARIVFVTSTSFFSDGSIFAHVPNARAFLPSGTAPEDLAAMVEHYARN